MIRSYMSMIDTQKAEIMLDQMESIVTAAQLADRIGVGQRTIYRYVNRLRSAGYSIASGPGQGGGFLLRRRCPAANPHCGDPKP